VQQGHPIPVIGAATQQLAGLGRIDEAKQAAREANLGDDVRARIARRTNQSI